MNTYIKQLMITSSSFENNGVIPIEYTGRGIDISPSLTLEEIDVKAKSIAIIMEDLDHPLVKDYAHWVIWNIPIQRIIPENIPHGESVLNGATQGVGYGKHRYKGPKPPRFIKKPHRYRFNVYVLDSILNLDSSSKKKELIIAMKGHIIQQGNIIGEFKNN